METLKTYKMEINFKKHPENLVPTIVQLDQECSHAWFYE